MNKLWNCKFMSIGAALGVASLLTAAAPGVVRAADAAPVASQTWNFNDGAVMDKPLETLRAAGWSFNAAAEQPDAVTVRPGALGVLQNYLAIEDVVNGGAGSFPVARLNFAPQANGQLTFKAVLFGVKNQFGVISLMSGQTLLAQITIKNGEGGTVRTGDGEVPFTGTGWAKTGGAVGLTWTAAAGGKPGRAGIVVDGLEREVVGASFLADAVPDAIEFQAGFNSGVKKGLALDDIQLDFPQKAAG